ncbi:MAG: hypothetical protein D6731_04730 [Planctomycetota bacterium]|nr:MAG: hypothetical protein D6731_04730 [Planctomycetota bacterium]
MAALRSLANRAEREPELAELLLRATTPEPLYPPLERATVEDWAMTQLRLHAGRPEVAPWLRGWVDTEARTRLIWRRQLPVTPERAPSENELRRYVEVAPPLLAEVLEAETAIVFDWLKKRLKELDKERSKASLDEGRKEQLALLQRLAFFVLDPDGELERVFPLDDALRWVGSKNAARQLAGRTLIFSSLIGGLESGGLDAKAKGTAPAADEEAPFGGESDLDPPPVTFRVRQATEQAHELEDPRWRLRERLPLRVDAEGEVLCWLAVYKWTNAAETEEDRSVGRPQSLAEHQEWVRERAEGEAQSLGLSESLERVLAAAALSHDEGKRARRWQEAFRAPSEGGPYAKTLGPLNVALLGGYRHEFGSLPYAAERADPDRWTDDERDLLLHLVAAHHGYARPFLRPDGCEQAPPSRLESRSREVTLRYFRLQRRWGPWGLAYLEALLRAADQRASRDNDALALAGAKEGLRAD